MENEHEKYFDLYFRKRITEYKKIDDYKNWNSSQAKTVFKSLDHFYLEELGIDSKRLGEIRKDFDEFKNIFDKYFNDNRKELFGDHGSFMQWYKNQFNEANEIACGYCGITQSKLKIIVKNRGGNFTYNEGTKRSKGSLEIEKLNPKLGYTYDNCIIACPLCNNAKSNLISDEDWRTFFVESMKKYYEKELTK